jgi:hypothetical protein
MVLQPRGERRSLLRAQLVGNGPHTMRVRPHFVHKWNSDQGDSSDDRIEKQKKGAAFSQKAWASRGYQ